MLRFGNAWNLGKKGGTLNIKYNKQKQELRDDPVIDGLLKTKEFVQKNNKSLIGTLIAIIVIAVVVFGFNYYRTTRIKNAQEDFGKAMVTYGEENFVDAIDQFRMVSETYKGTVTGTMSAYMLGGILAQQGRYDEAITWYESAVKGKNAGFIAAQAYEGLAACYDAKQDTVSALRNLEKALLDDRMEHRRNAVRWKIALLSREADVNRSKKMCEEIIADSLGQDYRQNAEYLKATLIGKTAG